MEPPFSVEEEEEASLEGAEGVMKLATREEKMVDAVRVRREEASGVESTGT